MSVDALARQAGARLREEVLVSTSSADVEESLSALHARAARRTGARAVAGSLAVAATVAVVSGGMLGSSSEREEEDPARIPSTTFCSASELVLCTENGRVTVHGPAPFGFTVIPGFQRELDATSSANEVVVFSSEQNAGVTFLVDPTAVKEGAGSDATSLARWIGSRPFLRTDTLRTHVGGEPGWRVDAALRPGEAADRARSCNGPGAGSPCRALLRVNGEVHGETGPWTGMVSRFHLVELSGRHTLVVWSWSFDGPEPLEQNDRLVRTAWW